MSKKSKPNLPTEAENQLPAKPTETKPTPKVAETIEPTRPFGTWFKVYNGIDEGTSVGASIRNGINLKKPVTRKEFETAIDKYLKS